MVAGVTATLGTLPLAPVRVSAPLPRVARVRYVVEHPRESDVAEAVRRELGGSGLQIPAGARIAVTAGSRGLHDLQAVLRATVDWLRQRGAEPFVVPAMGSHGGATTDGQRALLAHLGVTEPSIGAPILATMDTVDLGGGPDGIPVHMDAIAAGADGVLVVNRVKPHTDFHGDIESGIAKMTAIGLSNQAGAAALHAVGPGRLSDTVREVARVAVVRGRVLGGLAVVENGRGQTARVAFVPADGIGGEAEQALLEQARGLLARLPFPTLDVLVVDNFGKDVSGSGMDTNVIGRMRIAGVEDLPTPAITNIVALRLTPDSDGNAYGVGLADFTTCQVAQSLDLHAMYTNALTAGIIGTRRVALPMALADEASAVSAAVLTSGSPDPAACRLVRLHSTLDLADMLVSEALLPGLAGEPGVEEVAEPAPWTAGQDGSLTWPAPERSGP